MICHHNIWCIFITKKITNIFYYHQQPWHSDTCICISGEFWRSRRRRRRRRRTLEHSTKIFVSESVSAWGMPSSTISRSLPTLKSVAIDECLVKKGVHLWIAKTRTETVYMVSWTENVYPKYRIILKCKTVGQLIVFYKVPVPRKSADVNSPLRKRRAKVTDREFLRTNTGRDDETERKRLIVCKGAQKDASN